jgi:hypothetical protein
MAKRPPARFADAVSADRVRGGGATRLAMRQGCRSLRSQIIVDFTAWPSGSD